MQGVVGLWRSGERGPFSPDLPGRERKEPGERASLAGARIADSLTVGVE